MQTAIADIHEQGEVILNGQLVGYAVKRSSRAKNLRLVVDRDGLIIVAPAAFDLTELNPLLQQKKQWLLNQFQFFKQIASSRPPSVSPPPEPQASLDAGIATLLKSPLFFLGRECHIILNIEPHQAIQVRLKLHNLYLTVPDEKVAVAALETWYQRRSRQYFHKRTEELARVIGVTYNSLQVRPLTRRWGSCTSKRNLSFNWRLIMAPPSVIDYVIIHELCHLIELNHSKRFWAIVASRCPTYYKERLWLRDFGDALTLNLPAR